jgi:hypothetical protein
MSKISRKKRLSVLKRKSEDIAFASAEAVLAGIVIANIVSDSDAKFASIILGLIAVFILFGISYYLGLFNDKK